MILKKNTKKNIPGAGEYYLHEKSNKSIVKTLKIFASSTFLYIQKKRYELKTKIFRNV